MPESQRNFYDPRSDLLRGRVIAVTGAGDGIGRVAACTFARFGADVLLIGRTRQKLENVSDAIRRDTATNPLIVPLDLLSLEHAAVAGIQESFAKEYSKVHGLLHNASILGPKVPIEHYPPDEWIKVMKVNMESQFLLTQIFLPLLRQSEDSSIVLTSSGVGRIGRAYWGAYAVSKFATEGFMEVLADELKVDAIRVNSLNPGGTRTSMRAAAYPAEDPATLPTPEEHMPLYLYLMGPHSRGVTGRKFDASSWSGPSKDS